jgi:hypothetical protein
VAHLEKFNGTLVRRGTPVENHWLKQTMFIMFMTTLEVIAANVPFHNCVPWNQSYQTMISLFFQFLLSSLAILKYRQYFLMLQTLKLNNKN